MTIYPSFNKSPKKNLHKKLDSTIELSSVQILAIFANMADRVFIVFHAQNLLSGGNIHLVIPDLLKGIFEDVSKCVLFTVDRIFCHTV